MKISFISYEYPPESGYGGIATYVYQAAKILQKRGHYIEIFASSPKCNSCENEDGILVHRVKETSRQNFHIKIAEVFSRRHKEINFDVIESPEYCSEAQGIVKIYPDIPLIVKLHTPSFIINRIRYEQMSFIDKIRCYIGTIRRGIKPPEDFWVYRPKHDAEMYHTLNADEITTPSVAMGEELIKIWGLDKNKVVCIPNPYVPSTKLLEIPTDTDTNVISFIGRLEIRKGVIDLAKAIPLILHQYPNAKFRFIGAPLISPNPRMDMRQYLEQMLEPYKSSVEFTGHVSLEEIPYYLANTDICIFPSIWECFGIVCLEAMAAGRGIIASNAGGMAEILDYGYTGKLIPPRNPQQIAQAAIELLGNPQLRIKLGELARSRVVREYNTERFGVLQESSYQRAISRRKAAGIRSVVYAKN
jgi:glycogen synthase